MKRSRMEEKYKQKTRLLTTEFENWQGIKIQ